MAIERIRLARAEDAPAIAAIYAPYVRDTTVSFELEAPTATQIQARLASVMPAYPWLVLEREGAILAYAYATRLRGRPAYDWAAESSVYVDRGHTGAGLGARVYRALLDLLALQGLVWAYGAVALPNPGSQRFHADLGFEHVGRFEAVGFKHGRWCDIDWWRLRLVAELPGSPAPPRPIDAPQLQAAIAARLAAAAHHS